MPETDFDNFFKSGNFLESQYHVDYTTLGKKLKSLHNIIGSNPNEDHVLSKEFYFGLAEDVIADCAPLYKQLQDIPSIKASTKKDIMRRLTKGKDFIDGHFTSDIYVEQIASEALMSQFHFYRLFKKVYGKSPYQYIKEKRLALAHQYIINGTDSITEIALKVGYADLFSFSKGYKQFYGNAPSNRQ
jgi:AraC family transcriptional regulator